MAPLALFNEGAPGHFFHLMEAPMMRLPNVKMLLCWPSRMHIYGLVKNHTFLEQFLNMGVPRHFHFDGPVGPLECILMPPLALFNEGAPGHFFHLMEAPMMRLPKVKMLLRWPSRMHIYGFVKNHTFLEQFVNMGVPRHFPILWLNGGPLQ